MARQNKYDRQHAANVAYYQRLIDAIFEAATKEAAAIGSRVDFDPSRVFSFDDYPITQDLVKKLLSRLGSGLEAAIVDGVRSEWTLANNKNDELARVVFGDNVGRLTKEQYRRYFSNNDKAREAFLNRKEQGLNLSERVWRYADQFKSDIELGLDIGIRSGLDAPAMSRELQKFLQHPDMLFRRVRDEHGMLQLSKRASEFHPGQGVYRSSYKNARRLAATETNMAYMSADHERWQQLDFVVGIEIRLSGNHTCLGRDGKPHPFHDICDELQGRYPKDFKFTGWHPHCRCIATSILKTEKELMEENRAILRGEEPSQESANTVTDVPDNFKKWVTDNAARIAKAKQIPYFMRDNASTVSRIFTAAQPSTNLSGSLAGTVVQYFDAFRDRDPRLAAISNELMRSDLTDIEQAMLLNQFKTISAHLTYADFKKWGIVDDNIIMSAVDRQFVVQHRAVYTVKGTMKVLVPEYTCDMVVLKDKQGNEFAYPVGVSQSNVLIKATEASEALQKLPAFLRSGIERVSFYPRECPADRYWKLEYNNPAHVSGATDGGMVSFWKCTKGMSKERFMEIISHEAAHILDDGDKYSNSAAWKDAVAKDIALAEKGNTLSHPTTYAKTNYSEDFAESVMMFLEDRKVLKMVCPNRERYLHELTKNLGKGKRYL